MRSLREWIFEEKRKRSTNHQEAKSENTDTSSGNLFFLILYALKFTTGQTHIYIDGVGRTVNLYILEIDFEVCPQRGRATTEI